MCIHMKHVCIHTSNGETLETAAEASKRQASSERYGGGAVDVFSRRDVGRRREDAWKRDGELAWRASVPTSQASPLNVARCAS
jgi:hypothetical protein